MSNQTNMKTSKMYVKLNSLQQNVEDPSILNALFIIHDFELSWNGQVITEEVCVENMNTLINKPIVCHYIPKDENDGLDALTDHEEFIDVDRNTDKKFISTNTIAIGVINEVYIDTYTNENGDEKKALFAKSVLWYDKYRNICSLLQEWVNKEISIPASVEYMYCNYNVVDSVEYVQSPIIYLAHALLNAEDRNDYPKISPAYDSARLISLNMQDKWNKAVAQAISHNKQINKIKEGEAMFFKKVNELSHGDVRSKIYEQLAKIMSADEYNRIWISSYGVYDNYFIYEVWVDDGYEYFKVEYAKNESDELSINLDSKVKVEKVSDWKEVKNQIQTLNTKVEELEVQLSTKEETIISLNSEKETLSTELNSATEKLTSLNSKLETLEEIEKQFNADKFAKALSERKIEFETKFKSVNAIDKFNSEEVQDMIKNSIEDGNVLNSLNAMIVELIPAPIEDKKDEDKFIKDLNNKQIKNLIPKDNSFESRYME